MNKKLIIGILSLILVFSAILLFACEDIEIPENFTVIFYDEDGTTELKSETLSNGSEIEPPQNPEIEGDAQYSYTFSGWSVTVPQTITENITFTAQYTQTVNNYTYTFYDEDGTTVLKSQTLPYGSEIQPPQNPTKESNAEYSYTLSGWSVTVPQTITENISFTAQYTQTVNSYTYTFYDEDGTTVLKSQTLPFGSEIIPPASAKEGDAQYSFLLSWSSEVPNNITQDVTFTAHYTQTVNNYTYTFYEDDGITVIKSETLPYNSEFSAPSDPIKADTAQYTYEFIGWSIIIPDFLTEDLIILAQYSYSVRSYAVMFFSDGSIAYEEIAEYGTIINPPENVDKEGHTFIGWFDNIEHTGDALTFPLTLTEDIWLYAA